MCVCVCLCFRPPVRLVCLNHEVAEFQPRKVTGPDLGSDSNSYTISNPPAPPIPPVFWIVFFPLPLGLSPIPPPSFHLSTPLLCLFASSSFPPLSPGHGVTVHLDSAPARRLPPPSLSGFPPFPSSTCAQVPVGHRFFPSRCTFLPLPVSINLTPTHPPAGLYRWPSPLPVPIGGVVLLFLISPVRPSRPPQFIPCHLLMSSEVSMFLVGCTLALRREA